MSKGRLVKVAACAVVAIGLAGGAAAERVTFTKDVLPILQENCQSCHRPYGKNMSGMIAPMSLITYQEVRPWAKAIARAVESKAMPPWHATEATHGVFRNERTLTDDEIATITKWVEQRAPRGRQEDAPAPIDFSTSGWNFGDPDLVIDFPEPFFVEDDVQDLYHNITVQLTEEQLPEERWIKSLEFKPGSEIVHHIIGYARSVSGDPEADPEAEETSRGMIGGNAPGKENETYPSGFGMKLRPHSHVTFAMHYHKEPGPGTGRWDSSQIGVQFHERDAVIDHPVEITNIAYGGFEIPPNHGNWKVGASKTFEEDTLLLSLMPHMHLRGKAAKYTAFYPDGSSEELLDVPNYDFNWQTQYNYAVNKELPKGTRLEMEFWFDNSPERGEFAGVNPDRAVRFGGPTTDEMDLAWITVAPAEPVSGD